MPGPLPLAWVHAGAARVSERPSASQGRDGLAPERLLRGRVLADSREPPTVTRSRIPRHGPRRPVPDAFGTQGPLAGNPVGFGAEGRWKVPTWDRRIGTPGIRRGMAGGSAAGRSTSTSTRRPGVRSHHVLSDGAW